MSAIEGMLALHTCLHCKAEFTPNRVGGRHKGLFCSRECSTASRKTVGKCATCGAEFGVTTDKKTYCSQKCSGLAHSGAGNPSWNGGKQDRTCVVCGAEFQEYPSVARKTCCKACAEKTPRSMPREQNSNWSGGKEVNCRECGKPMWESPSQEKVFCSTVCFHKNNFSTRESKRWNLGSRWGMKGTKSGKRADIGIYVRSSWEANYARYLNWLIAHGQIAGWEYEKETFEFVGIKRGTRFYTPDFKVRLNDGTFEYHEVKGWMHPKGKTALDRMSRYHPGIKIILIQKKEYAAIASSIKGMIPTWE